MSLLPSTDDVSSDQEGEIRVHGVADEEMADVIDALASETARRILTVIYDEPAPPAEIADRLDLSLQNVMYHLDNLHEADVIRVTDTQYSQKGKEMSVYAPADDPVVVFVGTEMRKTRFLDRLKRLVGATIILLVASVIIFLSQYGNVMGLGSGDGGDPTYPLVPIPGLEFLAGPFVFIPGLEFLAGGLFVLGLIVLWWVWTR